MMLYYTVLIVSDNQSTTECQSVSQDVLPESHHVTVYSTAAGKENICIVFCMQLYILINAYCTYVYTHIHL